MLTATMPNSVLRTILHQIGYACTVLVAVELIAAGSLAVLTWRADRAARAAAMDRTRTHDGPLTQTPDDATQQSLRMMALLPPEPALRDEGLRFAALPALGWHWYAVSLAGKTNPPQGVVVVAEHDNASGRLARITATSFVMSQPDYLGLVDKFDSLAAHYAGDPKTGWCMDGTEIGFERVTPAGITSGAGNEACIAHYRELSAEILAVVRKSASLTFPPYGPDWMSDPSDEQKRQR
jgi:hypothetical protein